MVFSALDGRPRKAATLFALLAPLFLAAAGAGFFAADEAAGAESCLGCAACERGECSGCDDDAAGPATEHHHCCAASCMTHAPLTLAAGPPQAPPVPRTAPPVILEANLEGPEPETPHQPPRS